MRGHCGMDKVARVRRATLHTAPVNRKAPFPDFGRELAEADPQLLLQPAPMAPSDAPVAAPATAPDLPPTASSIAAPAAALPQRESSASPNAATSFTHACRSGSSSCATIRAIVESSTASYSWRRTFPKPRMPRHETCGWRASIVGPSFLAASLIRSRHRSTASRVLSSSSASRVVPAR